MIPKNFTLGLAVMLSLIFIPLHAHSDLRDQAQGKMEVLSKLIDEATHKGINVLKEKTALRTAEIFMGYADWDEQHVEQNTKSFKLVARYKKDPEKWALLLADYEREEIAKMMDSSIAELQAVMKGERRRLPTPDIDWGKVTHERDALYFEGKPVFLADWTWKPKGSLYQTYHGQQDGFFLTPTYVINDRGEVNPRKMKELQAKPDGKMGFIFFNHAAVPQWAKKQAPTITQGAGIKYTMYDINHPLTRQIQSDLIAKVVPLMAGKKYTQLGYMLCNEPHWNTIEHSWASAPISEHAYQAFKQWLQVRHGSIQNLNILWGTDFTSFDTMDSPRMMTDAQQGTSQYVDFMLFNMDRVTDWFAFLKEEIQKYDPQAKTHLKIMPNLWSEGKRDHGIDMEALTRNSEIIGNDAGSCGKWMWGPAHHWEETYSFDWKELAMAQDFFTSVSPNHIMYNTEAHFLSTGKTRDLYQVKEYARCNYWLATLHGMTASQTWYWARLEDGSSRASSVDNGYAGSNNHQPRIVNEVHATMLDLNSVSDKIMNFQRQEKSIRIFYSKASSIPDLKYMDRIYAFYESLYFEGMPIGFATQGIIEHQGKEQWQVIAVTHTPRAFEQDIVALQAYLDRGGVVLVDEYSLKTDEYGRPLKNTLHGGKGKLLYTKACEMKAKALAFAPEAIPELTLIEHGKQGKPVVNWRVLKEESGSYILNLVHLGKYESHLSLQLPEGDVPQHIENVLTGEKLQSSFTMKPYDVLLLEVK